MSDKSSRGRPGARTKTWIGLGVALAAGWLLYSGFWLFVANRAGDTLDAWAEGQRQAGYDVRWDGLKISGYPFRLIALLDRPRVSGAGQNSNQWAWQVDALTVSGRPWSWNALHVDAPGQHSLTFSGDNSAPEQRITVDAGALNLEAKFQDSHWRGISVAASDLRISEDDRTVVELTRFSGALTRENIVPVDERTRTGAVQLEVDTLNIPILAKDVIRVAGSVVRYGFLNVEFYGPLPGDLTAPSLAAWRDAGGVAEVRRLLANYGSPGLDLGLDADGTLALDGQLQPVGSFVVRLDGFSGAVDALRAAGMISASDAQTAKLVLGALAKKDTATGDSRLTLPISLQDNTLSAGPLALTKVPVIHW